MRADMVGVDTTEHDDIELPPDVKAALNDGDGEEAETTRRKRLDDLSELVYKKRDQAIQARIDLGIEARWMAAEEAYVGIDDVNRGEVGAPMWTKSPSMGGAILSTTRKERDEDTDEVATIFVRATARYTDMAVAKISEIILAPDEKSFSATATPIPSSIADDTTPMVDPETGRPMERDPKPHELPQTGNGLTPQAAIMDPQPNQPAMGEGPGKPLTPADLAEEALATANKKAKRAETRIHDQFVESQYNKHARKVLFDAVRLGVGVIKGPYATKRKYRKMQKTKHIGPDGVQKTVMQLTIEEKIVPGVKHISPWDFFPDGNCGEDIHNGEVVFERDYVTERTLNGLKRVPGYLADQIDRVIELGPERSNLMEDEVKRKELLQNDTRYRIWYGQMHLNREDILFLNKTVTEKELKGEAPSVTVTIVNNCIIQVLPNLMDSGDFIYDTMSWQSREGSWAGVGLPEQLDTPQRIINGATRAMMTNAGDSSGGQVIVDRGCVDPVGGKWRIHGRKLWEKKSDSIIDDVRKAFTVIQLPNATPQLMSIVEYGFRLAEEVSNVPLISQGQSGKAQPETLGGMQLQDSNANQLLRYVASTYDDNITGNLVPRFYEWNMLDENIPDEEKGDVVLHCQGSSALVERHIQDQILAQLGNVVKDPAFGLNPRKWARVYLRSKRINPDDVAYTKDELQKIDSQPPPVAPQVMAAQVNADAALKRVQMEHEMRMQELQANIQLAMLKMSNEQKMSLDEIKAKLSETTMELQVQMHLAGKEAKTAPQVATPPMEPVGIAKDGHAYEQ